MKASELVGRLNHFIDEYGDSEVRCIGKDTDYKEVAIEFTNAYDVNDKACRVTSKVSDKILIWLQVTNIKTFTPQRCRQHQKGGDA